MSAWVLPPLRGCNASPEEIMRIGIPLLADRVAPRCTFADSVLVVNVKGRRVRKESVLPLEGTTWMDLAGVLNEAEVETLVCGGISQSTRESIRSKEVQVIENVAGTSGEVLEALRKGRLYPGFGLARKPSSSGSKPLLQGEAQNPAGEKVGEEEEEEEEEEDNVVISSGGSHAGTGVLDCIACKERVCLQGERCPFVTVPPDPDVTRETREILESAVDVAWEEERTLCRLAELVYFALEMEYKTIGVAFCMDLLEPTSILTDVLRRFFQVIPVCCKVGGVEADFPMARNGESTVCDPVGQAAVLNARETDLNVLVGLCVGADAVFNRNSRAPVTTIFVKDKSLANNPIGAVYSHYYLTDI
jgi:uncharacterized metal-binding protein/predicted Fe-Mo cluster-binding NifX family protein